jgi:hypothetical protein
VSGKSTFVCVQTTSQRADSKTGRQVKISWDWFGKSLHAD